jgi:hypothetical protein
VSELIFLTCEILLLLQTVLVAIRRQLSELHPLFKLLLPHFRYTMNINSRARGQLIPAQGTVETNFTPGPYSMQVRDFLSLFLDYSSFFLFFSETVVSRF